MYFRNFDDSSFPLDFTLVDIKVLKKKIIGEITLSDYYKAWTLTTTA